MTSLKSALTKAQLERRLPGSNVLACSCKLDKKIGLKQSALSEMSADCFVRGFLTASLAAEPDQNGC